MQSDLTKKDILASPYFSDDEKAEWIERLYGRPQEYTWKRDLEQAWQALPRWNQLFDGTPPRGMRYHTSLGQVIRQARRSPPAAPGARVSDFTDWIYSLYRGPAILANLTAGAEAERWVEQQRLRRQFIRSRVPLPQNAGWKLIHNGLQERAQQSALRISELAVAGQPLWGSPDLVFREKGGGRILIVEIKVTNAPVPDEGWPNLGAQLWAYAKIDRWRDAPEIRLAGEIWGRCADGCNGLLAVRCYRADNPDFEAAYAELFARYCAKVA